MRNKSTFAGLFLFSILVLIPAVDSASLPSSEWKYVQQLEVTGTGLVKVNLPIETLDASRPALEDLRIQDPDGNEVPFWIERSLPAKEERRKPKTLQVQLAPEFTRIDVETGVAERIEGITLEISSSDFLKAVQIEGSRERRSWEVLASGQPIFRKAESGANLFVKFDPGVWPYLRISMDDRRTEPLPVSGILLHIAREPVPSEPLDVKIVNRAENIGQTELSLDLGGSHLTLGELEIETSEPLFTRNVRLVVPGVSDNMIQEQTLASGTVYRISFDGTQPSAQLTLAVERQIPAGEVQLIIENQDSPPIAISRIIGRRRPVHVLFPARLPGSYRLLTGNTQSAAPAYDLAALASSLKGASPMELSPSTLAVNPSYQPPEPLPEIRDGRIVIDLSKWKYRKQVLLAGTGVHQLELDLEVQSHTGSDLADLRIVQNEQQIPYLLERNSITRALSPAITEKQDPERPSYSIWTLQLPYASLPIQRLRCKSNTAVFDRQFTLYEEEPDERGSKRKKVLGQAHWVNAPDRKQDFLILPLSHQPSTDRLFLETDNGDNPPVSLQQFELFHGVDRVYFKTTSGEQTYLYYGNREAGRPRYDIQLLASQILAAEKIDARLGSQEQSKEPSWTEAIPGRANTIFWIALILVVVTLLLVITRLLPKKPA